MIGIVTFSVVFNFNKITGSISESKVDEKNYNGYFWYCEDCKNKSNCTMMESHNKEEYEYFTDVIFNKENCGGMNPIE